MKFYFPPILKKMKRGPQVMLPKDLGMIVAYTGMNKKSIVVDAGAGSGFSTVFFASIAKKVYSFEIRKDFFNLAKENIERSKLKNIKLFNQSVFEGINKIKENIDIINLDLPNPEKIFECEFNLKNGGFIVCALPNVEQVARFVKVARDYEFETFTLENIIREILVREEGTRPETKGLFHTVFLTFAKKKF